MKGLGELGLRPKTKSDSQPGLASLVEVETVSGHVLQFYSHIDAPVPGFKEGGVAPIRLGHVAVISPEADKLRRFYEDFLGFWYTDEFDGIAVNERIAAWLAKALELFNRAETANPEMAREMVALARQWRSLAEHLQKQTNDRGPRYPEP